MEQEYTPNISEQEKLKLIDLYATDKEYIDNVGNYLADNFKKIDGFDYRWNSLITSKPLLFEDIDYLRVRDFIKNECTELEIKAYKEGKLRELYATFENMLVCNLQFYDRIMNFCTMIFLKYVRISEDEVTNQHLKKLPYVLEMTPTQIWCCALTNQSSTEWELNYAWNYTKKNIIKIHSENLLKDNYRYLYKNQIFARFVEYASVRNGTQGFMTTLYADKTPNHKLSQVCSKFTRTSTAIDDTQLETLINYISEDTRSIDRLYFALKDCLKRIYGFENEYAIYCFADEFFIFTRKFKMKICKDQDGKIEKHYLSNNYECFIAESYLSETIKYQIEWARYTLPIDFEYDKQILQGLLLTMLNENFHEIKCIRKMQDYKVYSEVIFSGAFNNVYAHEKFIFNDEVIHENTKCLGKENMSKYLINRGYYIFGTIHDVDVLFVKDITKDVLINHYANYCIPIMQHMNDIIMLHLKSKNDIIDVLVNGYINPDKLNTNVRYTILKGKSLNSREIMDSVKKLSNNIVENKNKLSYWKAISD